MKNNQRNGKGIFYFKDGGYYEGEWENDMKNNTGKMIYDNGSVYEGEWEDDNYRYGLYQ